MIQFDQIGFKTTNSAGLRFHSETRGSCRFILSGSYQDLRYLESSRRPDAARLVRGDVQRRVGKCPPISMLGTMLGTGGEKPLECQVENESWKITKVGKSLGEQYLLKHKRVYSW